jgi:uncharacterized protein
MGYCNSSTQCHDAGPVRVDRSGVARAAAEPSSTRGANGADVNRAAVWLLVMGIRFYQAVFAPVMPVGCKFYPSCSRYAAEAIARHGALRGVRLAAARLWRCRPFTQGGFDPVPDADESSPNEVRL